MKETEEIESITAMNAPRPVIYVRSATVGEGQLEERLEDARELARMNGLDVGADDTVAERGSGADIVGRPGLQRILQRIARGEISHLVVPRTSHLSRKYHDLRQILVTLAEAGVEVVTGGGSRLGFGCDVVDAVTLARWR